MTESDQTSLTPRREAFCRHVAEGLITAARLAGYAPGNARKTGHDLLRQPDISLRIPDLRNEAAGVRTWPRDDRGNRLPLFGDRECTRAPSLPSDLIFLDELQVVVQLFTISDTDMLIDTSLTWSKASVVAAKRVSRGENENIEDDCTMAKSVP